MNLPLEQQCVNLELSQKLKELGVKQESLWWWSTLDSIPELTMDDAHYSAFTVAELGMLLPNGLKIIVTTSRGISNWICVMEHIPHALRERLHLESADTEANARAKALQWLIESGNIDVHEINRTLETN